MDARKLGKKIKLARVELDLTQTELTQKIGAKQKSISRYEAGKSIPKVEALSKLANALRKTAAHFLE